MVKAVRHYEESLEDRMDALAIGPGLGAAAEAEVLAVVARAPVPVVLDADALNMLARSDMESLRARPAPTLLTPHPGEMARLRESFRSQSGPAREAQARELADRYGGTTVLLKGARTVIAGPGMPASFNTTGHPGMASGGMGDVLTGLCAALAAQGVPLPDAACLGAWLSGLGLTGAGLHGLEAGVILTFGKQRNFCAVA
jgi:NAD(P)H-hydrate epimerase